jgi:hypothetical protein
MKIISLLGAAYVNGVLRHPHEGAIPVDDSEVTRLIDDEALATDVTSDFTDAQIKGMTASTITADSGGITTPSPVNPHQAEVAPAPAPTPRRKASAEKE